MREEIVTTVRAVPAGLRLVFRLVRDERVDAGRRAAVVAALGYAVLPIDLIPDRVPIIGKVDDLLIGAAALQSLFDAAGADIVREHWDGPEEALEALQGIMATVSSFVPRPLQRLLKVGA